MGAVSFTASKVSQRAHFAPYVPGVVHVPYADPYRPLLPFDATAGQDIGDGVVDYIEKVLFKTILPANEVAAVLLEPIQGEGGYVVPAPHFLPRLRKMCDDNGILLIADEVQAGVGRTGKWWSIEHFGVEPDIIASAKGIASGMPFGAMMARKSVMSWKPGAHGNTYGGNPLACVAAYTTLQLIQDGYLANAREQGEYFMRRLNEMKQRHPSIGEVRGRGLMIGVEFIADANRTPSPAVRDRLVHHAFEHGLLLLGCGTSVVRVAPPLSIERATVDEGLEIFEYCLTLAEAAARLGQRSRNAYARYEQGRAMPTVEQVERLLEAIARGHRLVWHFAA